MTLAERQQQLADDLLLIEDPQERLAAIVDQSRKRPPLPATDRSEANRVPGCVSQAWVAGEPRDGRWQFRGDADSPLVRGLVLLLCDLYSGADAAEIAATEPTLIDALGLARVLSPTRLNGLRSVAARIRGLAAARPASGPE